jgi:hypothetical protein
MGKKQFYIDHFQKEIYHIGTKIGKKIGLMAFFVENHDLLLKKSFSPMTFRLNSVRSNGLSGKICWAKCHLSN